VSVRTVTLNVAPTLKLPLAGLKYKLAAWAGLGKKTEVSASSKELAMIICFLFSKFV